MRPSPLWAQFRQGGRSSSSAYRTWPFRAVPWTCTAPARAETARVAPVVDARVEADRTHPCAVPKGRAANPPLPRWNRRAVSAALGSPITPVRNRGAMRPTAEPAYQGRAKSLGCGGWRSHATVRDDRLWQYAHGVHPGIVSPVARPPYHRHRRPFALLFAIAPLRRHGVCGPPWHHHRDDRNTRRLEPNSRRAHGRGAAVLPEQVRRCRRYATRRAPRQQRNDNDASHGNNPLRNAPSPRM